MTIRPNNGLSSIRPQSTVDSPRSGPFSWDSPCSRSAGHVSFRFREGRLKQHRGYTVVSPEKLLETFPAHRDLRADTSVSTTLAAAQAFLNPRGTLLAIRIRQPRADLRRLVGQPRLTGRRVHSGADGKTFRR